MYKQEIDTDQTITAAKSADKYNPPPLLQTITTKLWKRILLTNHQMCLNSKHSEFTLSSWWGSYRLIWSKHMAVPAFVIKNRGTGGRSRSTCALLRVRPMKAVNSGSNRYQDIRSGERTYTQTTTTGQSRCWVDGIRLIYCLAMIGSRGGREGGQQLRWTAGLVCVCVCTNFHKLAVLSHLLWVRIHISWV